ncbi:MAG: polysaccharide ABC transporter ATP-binding protein [Candidatus Acidiferrales bacterium]
MNVIKVENIGKRYRVGELDVGGLLRDQLASALRNPASFLRRKPRESFWALRDISFDVKEGEVLGLIGRNGAGKSTLLKVLSRITAPTVGHAEIHGRVGSLLEVGTGFHPELSGRENIFLNGAILGMSKREIARKFDEIVAFAEVERFIDTPVKRYSSGMYVRLAFAVAAHLETEVLFIDEVLSVGDASFQKKCLGKMGDVANQGRTVIFVSHNMNALRKLCPRSIRLDAGRIVEIGDSEQLVNRYLLRDIDSTLEAAWIEPKNAPGDYRVRLRSVRVIPKTQADDLITVHTPICIEFAYWNYVPGAVLNVSMTLNTADEACVFCSVSDFVPRPAGLIRHTVTIPGDFLNAGSYHVSFIVVKDASTGILFQDNVVGFEAHEGEIIGNWYGKIPGVTRPKLTWESEVLTSDELAAAST